MQESKMGYPMKSHTLVQNWAIYCKWT